MEWLGEDYWLWWILAVVLFILELAAPGFFAIWLALAALVSGLVALLAPGLAWQFQILIFALLALGATVGAWKFYRVNPLQNDRPGLNRRGSEHVGRTATLDEAIVNGRGRLRIGDTVWRCSGPDLPAGTQVRVTGVENTTLTVEPA